ncbi:hypothetical protein GCM10007304_09750 [Rhodococcoides trifolii]|uniref:Uncharacterized protein n=1 Tax=Rhodococcoides trifolii TaxID=908250 RepID=A0A917CW45_9NOCA|nr:hypothetical protein GCM10007304_09750 [Rhodococcus trifolii]
MSRIDRDPATESAIADRLPRREISLPVTDVRVDGDRTTGSVMGARVLLDSPEPVLRISDSWPALSPGFYMVFGDERPRATGRDALWRVYLAADGIDAALDDFALAVGYLRTHGRRWQAKIASTPAVYPRTDAVTVYLDHTDRHHASMLADLVGSVTGRWNRVSAFVTELAPGVGFAQEPADPDPTRRGLSYGQHRASIVARAALTPGLDLAAALSAAGVDPVEYWRNSVADKHGVTEKHLVADKHSAPATPTLLAAPAASGSGHRVR